MITRARATALLFGGAAVSSVRLPVRAKANATVRLAFPPSDSAAEVYYAMDMRFFAKAGIDAEIQSIKSSTAIEAAAASTGIDIGFSDVYSLAAVHGKSIPLVVIAPASEYLYPATARIAALVIPADSPVQQAKDLNGKIIAVGALDGLAAVGPRVWIDQNGGLSSTVKFVEVAYSAMPGAFSSGRIDAAWVVEPFINAVAKYRRILAYGFYGISKHFLISAWFTTLQWAKDHPNLVNRFADVMRETAVWANQNAILSGSILAKYTQIDRQVITSMTRARYGEQLTPALMQPLVDVAAKYGEVGPFPARELIYATAR